MPAQSSRHATRGSRHATRAFSLAELMIALVILGLGLLFIAAALPVGLDYTRQTVDQATGEAAGGLALNQLELYLRTSGDDLYDPAIAAVLPPGSPVRLDNIHRPRDLVAGTPNSYPLNATHEPVIKVRPLVVGNVRFGPVTGGNTREIVDSVESTITAYFNAVGYLIPSEPLETDFDPVLAPDLSLGRNPSLPGVARVYPPIDPVTTFSVANFFYNNNAYPTYNARFAALQDDQLLDREREKALDRRVAWTAFYRRISYKGTAGPDGVWNSNDDVAEEPLTYELIIVVTRRPSLKDRFPRQDLVNPSNPFEQPQAWTQNAAPDDALAGSDRLAPTAWLVTFDSSQGTNWTSPQLTMNTDYAAFNPDPGNLNYQERVLLPANFADPPTVTFRCALPAGGMPGLGALLPVGSILIPAVNDQRYVPPAFGGPPQQVGFVPSAPNVLPIYEVVERPDETTVVVKNNGYYPWLNPASGGLDARHWPVWIIPPVFAERDSNGQPVYERTSPIVAVVRRTVTLREVRP